MNEKSLCKNLKLATNYHMKGSTFVFDNSNCELHPRNPLFIRTKCVRKHYLMNRRMESFMSITLLYNYAIIGTPASQSPLLLTIWNAFWQCGPYTLLLEYVSSFRNTRHQINRQLQRYAIFRFIHTVSAINNSSGEVGQDRNWQLCIELIMIIQFQLIMITQFHVM